MKTLFESILSNDLEDEMEQSVLISTLINCCDIPSKISIDGYTCIIDERFCSIWNDDFFKHLAANHIETVKCTGKLSINTYHGFSNFNISAEQIILRGENYRPSRYDELRFAECEFDSRSSISIRCAHFIVLKNCKLTATYTTIYEIDKPKFPGTKFECDLVMRYRLSNAREIRRINKYLNIFDLVNIKSGVYLNSNPYETEKPQLDIYKLLGTQIACKQLVYVTMGTDCDAGFVIEHSFTQRSKYPSIKCKNGIWVSPIEPQYTRYYI